MGKFNKGDSVKYRGSATYAGNGKCNQKSERGSSIGKAVKSTSSGVYVENGSGQKEFVHRNRITN